LPDFNETLIFSTVSGKKAQMSNFIKIRPLGADGHGEADSCLSQFRERA
jgi:hypothetical protein